MPPDHSGPLQQAINEQLAKASTYIPGQDPTLVIANASGCWQQELNGNRYLDFGLGGHTLPLGHRYMNAETILGEHLGQYTYLGSHEMAAAVFPAEYARLLSGHFSKVDEEPQQVLVMPSVADARLLIQSMQGEIVSPVVGGQLRDGGDMQDTVSAIRGMGKLYVADETLTGFGRTGKMWGFEHFGLIPDVTLLGASGGGGLPFAALVAPPKLFARIVSYPEMSANPMVCAAAHEVLIALTPALLGHVELMGRELNARCRELAAQFSNQVVGSTGVGLLQKLEVTHRLRREDFRLRCLDRGLILGPSLRMTPPLIVDEELIAQAIDIMAGVLLDVD